MNYRGSKIPSNPKNLFICATWSQVVMSLAYLDSVKDKGSHNFLILGDPTKSREDQELLEIRQAIKLLGHLQVDWPQASESEYEQLHLVPAYAMFSDDKRRLTTIRYKNLFAHADGLRNGVFVDHSLARDVAKIVHYGFRLIESVLLSTKLPKRLIQNSHVIPFESISRTWSELNTLLGDTQERTFTTKEDLLVCERYWSVDHYALKDKINPEPYFDSILRLEEGRYNRIIFRSTKFHGTQVLRWGQDLEEYAKNKNIHFVNWSDVFHTKDSVSILDHPEAQFYLGRLATLGGIFAFDGSLSVLFASLGKNTRVHWADEGDSEPFFVDHRIPGLLFEQGDWMRRVGGQAIDKDIGESLGDYETKGSTYKSIITELYLDVARSTASHQIAQLADKDAQLADKDAQLADKDAQLADKEAQLADKEAKLADKEAQLADVFETVSWKITRPLRLVRKTLP
jgi:hypothetical protein